MLEGRGLFKTFPGRRSIGERQPVPALKGVSLQIHPGEAVGLAGPNGSGKTTLLRTLCGFLIPDEGTVLFGQQAVSSPKLDCMGLVLNEDRSFYLRLSGLRNLLFFGRIVTGTAFSRQPRKQQKERAESVLRDVGLEPLALRTMYTYSSGERQRLGIARALLHDPPVVLLDEPARNLDVEAREWLGHFIRKGKDAGKAIVVTSHHLEELGAWCDRILILKAGTIIHEMAGSRAPAPSYPLQIEYLRLIGGGAT